MRKIVFILTTGMVAACALTVLMAADPDNKLPMEDFSNTEPVFVEEPSDLDLPLPILEAPQAAEQNADSAPVLELDLAQNPAPPAPAAPEAGNVESNVSNILADPALNPPAVNVKTPVPDLAPAAPAAPVESAEAPVKVTETTIPKLPPAQQSIVKPAETGEALPPAVTIDPTMEMGAPYSQQYVQSLPGTPLAYRGTGAPVLTGGSCPNCPQGVGYGAAGTRRPVYYGVQRNGLPAYPRAGNCCGCGGCGCPGCCGHRYPMEYPYYTLRGPRDFDDPNPRPIGP